MWNRNWGEDFSERCCCLILAILFHCFVIFFVPGAYQAVRFGISDKLSVTSVELVEGGEKGDFGDSSPVAPVITLPEVPEDKSPVVSAEPKPEIRIPPKKISLKTKPKRTFNSSSAVDKKKEDSVEGAYGGAEGKDNRQNQSGVGAQGSSANGEFGSARPDYLSNPPPIYPRASRRAREEGTVLLRVAIDAQGNPTSLQIKKSAGFSRLDEAALKTVRTWKFKPAQRDGLNVADEVDVPIRFVLK